MEEINLEKNLKIILSLSRKQAEKFNKTWIDLGVLLNSGIRFYISASEMEKELDKMITFSPEEKKLSEYLKEFSISKFNSLSTSYFSDDDYLLGNDYMDWVLKNDDSLPFTEDVFKLLTSFPRSRVITFKDILYTSLGQEPYKYHYYVDNVLGELGLSEYDDIFEDCITVDGNDEDSSEEEFKKFMDDVINKVKNGETLEERRLDYNGDDQKSKDADNEFEKVGDRAAVSMKKIDPDSNTPFLDEFATDMTKAAADGKYDPVIGRDIEVSQIFEILGCRKKNSAALLGDPGCGKSAIAEEIARRIATGNCPEIMKQKRVLMLDVNSMVAGTQFRGQFEQRVQGILKECIEDKDIIIFIDEFHATLNAGGSSSDGSGLSQLLKPALSRGEITCIASTTQAEYAKYVEKDGALKRRFQNVVVQEPSAESTLEILKGLRDKYSEYHKVTYTDEVLEYCVKFADRYIFNRFFPDKAIDIMDIAGSVSNITRSTDMTGVRNTEEELNKVIDEKIKAVCDSCDFTKASKCYYKEQDLKDKLEEELKKVNDYDQDKTTWPEVTIENVATVVSKISKVPVDDIINSDLTKLKEMKKSLSKEVVGQDKAVDDLITALQLNTLGLRDQSKPIASFLFLGKTGLGKTYICQKLAEKMFGSKDALITFAMGEMSSNEMSVSAFKGAAAGYVGYGDSDSILLEKVRKRPHSVVLFDEVEKANPQFFDVLLNILQEGWTTLSNGQIVSFKNTIIVMTGNLGTKDLMHSDLGFDKKAGEDKEKRDESIVINAAKKFFRPEFLNRLTGITVFKDFGPDEYSKIFDLEFRKVQTQLKERGFDITVSESLKNKIISSVDKNYGARDLTREINKWVQKEICKELLNQPNPDNVGNHITADLITDEKVQITFS